MIERITPPSTRNAAPLIAEESGRAMNVTSEATSSVEAKHLSNELEGTVAKNSFSTLDRSKVFQIPIRMVFRSHRSILRDAASPDKTTEKLRIQ